MYYIGIKVNDSAISIEKLGTAQFASDIYGVTYGVSSYKSALYIYLVVLKKSGSFVEHTK